MKNVIFRFFLLITFFLISNNCFAYVKGIYLTQSTAENTQKVNYFIQQARATGINTFVIDTNNKNSRFAANIARIQQNNIHYVARVVVFPDGGLASHIKSRDYWEKRWQQMAYAVSLGSKEIQLDYIRYKASQPPSHQNAKDIYQVIDFFNRKIDAYGTGIQLQIDIFGVAADKPSLSIGQSVPLFATLIDVICPMVYPSHYAAQPFPSRHPYETVSKSITALKKQLKSFPNVKVYAFIEANNYRYPMSFGQKVKYLQLQMIAARDAGADGWYVWSPKNQYDALFAALRS